MSSTEIRHGSCLCKAVKYELKGDPFTFFVCHCANCRKASGSAFGNNCFFKPENVVVTEGNVMIKTFRDTNTDSGAILNRSFCSNCGSTLFITKDHETYKMVAAGSIDDEVPWMPRKQVFEHSQRPWVEGIKLVPKCSSKETA